MAKWEQFDPTWKYSLREAAGCYVIFCNTRVLYIGQSENLRARFRQHNLCNIAGTDVMSDGHTRTPWGDFRWSIAKIAGKVRYATRFGEQLMVEARLIRRLQPDMNIRGVRNGR